MPHPQISNTQLQSDHEVVAKNKLHVGLAENELHIMQAVFLCELLHEESFFAHIPFSREKSKNMMVKTLEKPVSNGLLMAHYGEEPMECALFCAGEYNAGVDTLITTVMGLYVNPRWRRNPVGAKAALRLINGIKKWSDARNVSHISIHTTAGIDTQKTDKLLRRLGFITLGGNYVG